MSIQDMVIVGGGIGDIMAAQNFVMKLYPIIHTSNARIGPISNAPWPFNKPALIYVPYGMHSDAGRVVAQASRARQGRINAIAPKQNLAAHA